ncbi:hypothetical protein A7D17_16025 [Xanthomonas floridensis]|uniref:Uncharacterized protein n=1 Tax=Xanthomonas floridensis TaxID=1843580 RepID=A0A1A9MBM9_9XANT|nr:hypothetical protein A7D17_16025 [Xanthomonas floridensis]
MFSSFCGSGGTAGQTVGFTTCPHPPNPAKLGVTASNSSRNARVVVSIDLILSGSGLVTGLLHCSGLLVFSGPGGLLTG